MMTIEQALAYWVRHKKLTKKKALELVDSLPTGLVDHERREDMSNRAIGIFSAVGGILVGLGVLLFVATNWSEMTPVVKMTILMGAMLTTAIAGYYLAYEKKAYEKTGLALLFVNVFIFGASIFLVGQIYHLPFNYWWGALLWFLGAAIFALILQSRLHAWLSIPLFVLFLGWLRASIVGGSGEVDFLFSDTHSIITLFPLLGVMFVADAVFKKRWPYFDFMRTTLFHWGVFFIALVLVVTTVHSEVFYALLHFPTDTVSMVVIALTLITLIVALALGKYETHQGRAGLIALAVYVAAVYLLANAPTMLGYPEVSYFNYYDPTGAATSPLIFQGLFVVHVLLVFVFLFVIIWYGTLLRMPSLINLGMIGLAVTIFIQYFSWAFETLDRSLTFIIGGL